MPTKRISKNRVKRVGRKGQILNQFFRTLVKNKAAPEAEVKDDSELQPQG